MKRIIALILLAALTLCLVACGAKTPGNQGNSGNKGPAQAAADFVIPEGGFDTNTPVTITFYHQMGQAIQEILNTAIADFNKIYPNITVEHKTYGDYDGIREQIKVEIPVGNQPNIAYCYPDHVALYNVAGAVQTLDSLIDSEYGYSEEEKADFVPAYYNEGRAFGDGKMYTLPIVRSTEVLYYNKTFFEKHNLTVPTTWDEMEKVCREIKALEPNSIPLGYDSEANWFITMCEQYGSPYTSATGENFVFDNDTNKAFVKKFQSWYKERLVTTQALQGGYTSDLFKGADAKGSRAYMCIGSTGGATYQQPKQTNGVFEFEVGIAPIPQVDPANPKVISQGPSICIFKDEDPQKVLASWLFVKFLTTDVVFQGSVSMNNGYAPVIQSTEQNPAYAAFLASADTKNIQAYAVKVALSQTESYYVSPAFNGSAVARDQVGYLVQKCLALEGDNIDEQIDKAFAEAVAECKYQSGQ